MEIKQFGKSQGKRKKGKGKKEEKREALETRIKKQDTRIKKQEKLNFGRRISEPLRVKVLRYSSR
ncbi:hypothetical protein [Cecembia lonarensis]|uniref:hypothetical protein n=1 Tax=Cecembia lonarensis TaxID=645110 RepID=UPI00058CD6FE|nr:hypothetical protein [Cecembia lonarensis]